MALVKNIRTGKVTNVPDHYLNHPSLGGDLVLVTEKTTEVAIEKPKPSRRFSPKAAAPVEVEVATEGQFAPETDKENDEE